MTVALIAIVVPTHTRLDTECPVCGWADLWRLTLHSLTPHGVGTFADTIRCARCDRSDR